MSALTHIKNLIQVNPVTRKLIYLPYRFTISHTRYYKARLADKEIWARRTEEVMSCPDNAHIPRVPDAGSVRRSTQVMHNGLKIRTGSYYGAPATRMLAVNKGVHEPQEEWVFQEVLKHIRPDAVMIELGSYWGFYSMWFLSGHPRRRAILVEPDPENFKLGQTNFALNNLKGDFIQAFVDAAPSTDRYGRRTVSVDELVEQHRLDRIDILHADIQGYETNMLDGARRTLERRMIDYIFISTHGQDLHDRCKAVLAAAGFEIIADSSMADTYSFDGLITARRADVRGQGPVPISRKTAHGAPGP